MSLFKQYDEPPVYKSNQFPNDSTRYVASAHFPHRARAIRLLQPTQPWASYIKRDIKDPLKKPKNIGPQFQLNL